VPERRSLPIPYQGAIGLTLAALIIGAWTALHVYAVFFLTLEGAALLIAPAVVLLLAWLSVGLFIVAHDGMHGSLAPRLPALGHRIAAAALFLYAGFLYGRVLPSHRAHHAHPGTDSDPDFDPDRPDAFWPWYARFMRAYFGWTEFWIMGARVLLYLALGASVGNILLFFALPAFLSSLQLFAFGTWRPHRHGEPGFADRHNARSDDFPVIASLLTCFHFGYHHEHHARPGVPWWALPGERAHARARVAADLPNTPPAT